MVRDNQVSKKSRVAEGWASSTRVAKSRKEKKTIPKMTADKRARAWPFEVFVLALAGQDFLHCRNVPVPSQGQRVKDELGMRQGGEGGPSRVGLCHDLHARFGKGARGEGAGGSFVQSLRGPARGPDVEWSRRSEIRRPAGEIRRLVVWSLVDPPRPLSASSRLAASRVLASPQVLSESLAGVSAHHPQTRGRL